MAALRAYYAGAFPADELVHWWTYPAGEREVVFCLPGEIVVRNLTFSGPDALRKALVMKNPTKVHIGALWDGRVAVERELVFDIDLSDYKDRPCCGAEKKACSRCWPLVMAAVRALHAALINDFGYKRVLWVYSGRRGVHCWVCDRRARQLSNEARQRILDYLAVYWDSGDARALMAPFAKRMGVDVDALRPRLDAAVTKDRCHLLKIPFAVHPDTGRVCVPFDPDIVEAFNPETAPHVRDVTKQALAPYVALLAQV